MAISGSHRWAAGPGHWLSTALLMLLGASWGLQFTLLKIATGSRFSELAILTGSMILLAAAYLATLAVRRRWFRLTWRHVRFFFVSSLFGYVVPIGGVLWAADRLSAGLIVLYTEALIPVFTVAIAAGLRIEALSVRRLMAVCLALTGVAIAMWPELRSPGDAQLQFLMVVVLIPLSYAADGIYVSSRWPRDLCALQVVAGEAVAGAVMLLPVWLVLEGSSGLPTALPGGLGPAEWAILAFVPVTYLEVFLYFYMLRTRGAVFVSFACFVSLFAGFLWGMILLGEQHGAPVWIALALVSLALYLITVTRRESPAEPGPSARWPIVFRMGSRGRARRYSHARAQAMPANASTPDTQRPP